MNIYLKKFGTTLVSRQSGKEALAAFRPELGTANGNEKLFVDFAGVNTFSPSWADEFLTPLLKEYEGRIVLQNTENLSVQATLKMLEKIKNKEL
jgi:hypothetical protein